jgi:hypothetical protein
MRRSRDNLILLGEVAKRSYWNFRSVSPLTAITAPSSAFTGD